MLVFGLLLLGLFAGFMGAMLGIGGGIFITFFLVNYFGYGMREAVTAALFIVLLSSLGVGRARMKTGYIHLPLAILLETISALGGLIGAKIAIHIDEIYAKRVFALTCFALIPLMLRKSKPAISKDQTNPGIFSWVFYDPVEKCQTLVTPQNLSLLMLIQGGAGILSGIIGIGGGIIAVPTFMAIGHLPASIATATSSYISGLTVSSSAMVYMLEGHFSAQLLPPLLVGGLLGVYLNGRVSPLSQHKLRMIFVFVLVFFGGRTWLQTL